MPRYGREGIYQAARRLVARLGEMGEDIPFDDMILRVRAGYGNDPRVSEALDGVLAAQSGLANGGDVAAFREALAVWIDTVSEIAPRPLEETAPEAAALGDASGSVMAMLRGQGAAE